jgi:hypothetical protein
MTAELALLPLLDSRAFTQPISTTKRLAPSMIFLFVLWGFGFGVSAKILAVILLSS